MSVLVGGFAIRASQSGTDHHFPGLLSPNTMTNAQKRSLEESPDERDFVVFDEEKAGTFYRKRSSGVNRRSELWL
jgi:hypothetical protein